MMPRRELIESTDLVRGLLDQLGMRFIRQLYLEDTVLLTKDLGGVTLPLKASLTTSVSSNIGAQGVIVHTCPKGVRQWIISAYAKRVSGDRLADELWVYDSPTNGNLLAYFTSTSQVCLGNQAPAVIPIRLEPGWTIRYHFTGGTTDGSWNVGDIYEEEALP